MTSKRLYYALIGMVCLLVAGLFAGTYFANTLLRAQADRLVQARLQSQALDVEQQELSKTKNDIVKYQALADIAKSVAPQDKDQAQAVREIVQLAGQQGIKLGAITFPNSTLGGTGSGTAVAGGGNPKMSQLKPAQGIPGVYDLQITVQSDAASPVGYDHILGFLESLEHNRRTALVNGITLQPDAKNSNAVTFSLTIDEYVKP